MITANRVKLLLAGSTDDREIAESLIQLSRSVISSHCVSAERDHEWGPFFGCNCKMCKECALIAKLKIDTDKKQSDKIPLKADQTVQNYIRLCDDTLDLLHELENDPTCGDFPASYEALEFARGTRPKIQGMRDYADKHNRVTDKMWTAANNINRGTVNWSNDQRKGGSMFHEDDYPIFHDF